MFTTNFEKNPKFVWCFLKSWNWELNSCWRTWFISVYILVWVGFYILRVKMHAWLFKCNWNSQNQSFFLNILMLLYIWFVIWFFPCSSYRNQIATQPAGVEELHFVHQWPATSLVCFTAPEVLAARTTCKFFPTFCSWVLQSVMYFWVNLRAENINIIQFIIL